MSECQVLMSDQHALSHAIATDEGRVNAIRIISMTLCELLIPPVSRRVMLDMETERSRDILLGPPSKQTIVLNSQSVPIRNGFRAQSKTFKLDIPHSRLLLLMHVERCLRKCRETYCSRMLSPCSSSHVCRSKQTSYRRIGSRRRSIETVAAPMSSIVLLELIGYI